MPVDCKDSFFHSSLGMASVTTCIMFLTERASEKLQLYQPSKTTMFSISYPVMDVLMDPLMVLKYTKMRDRNYNDFNFSPLDTSSE